jgi:hypothetical protein
VDLTERILSKPLIGQHYKAGTSGHEFWTGKEAGPRRNRRVGILSVVRTLAHLELLVKMPALVPGAGHSA